MKNTKEKIFKAAKELFSQKGYAAVTTKELADAAGVSEVTIFRHFENKRKLFQETIKHYMCAYQFEQWLKDEITYDLEKDLTQIAHYIERRFCENGPLIKMMLKDVMSESNEETKIEKSEHQMKGELVAYFKEMKNRGYIDDDPRLLTIFFLTNINGYMMRNYVFKAHHDQEECFPWIIQKIIQAIKK
jgi:AcrR family transcriptional regulator